jgi:enamine deaminase RidA (YjgF/YER057c/UK114 family)
LKGKLTAAVARTAQSIGLPKIVIAICLRPTGMRRNIRTLFASCNHAMPERGRVPLACARLIGEDKAFDPAQQEDVMAGTVDKKLAELGIALPTSASPVANYIPFVRVGSLLFVSGQICLDAAGKLVAKGKLGSGVSLEDGQKAARACAINVLAQVKAALGDLDKVKQVVRLGGFINSDPAFVDGPKVMNGASDLMVAVLGDKGRHARSTVGVAVLPADAAVEVEGIFEVA